MPSTPSSPRWTLCYPQTLERYFIRQEDTKIPSFRIQRFTLDDGNWSKWFLQKYSEGEYEIAYFKNKKYEPICFEMPEDALDFPLDMLA